MVQPCAAPRWSLRCDEMKTILLISLFLSSLVQAAPRLWKDTTSDLNFLNGSLEFFNRSACAKKSYEPTTSVFLIVDNVNIAKSVYRLAKTRGLDTTLTTNQGIEKFRYTLTGLIRLIGDKLLDGSLPAIPLNGEKITDLPLKDALLSCDKNDCRDLDDYLENAWTSSLPATGRVSCKVIKKFSTFHSNLRISKPDRVLMEELAKEMQTPEQFVKSCTDLSDTSEPEVALYQFDLADTDKTFIRTGFDFWNSLKIYLSWAMRNAPEMKAMAQPFDFLFQSVNIEEMVIFFSNGCRSIKPAECSQGDLNLENLRSFTQGKEGTDWSTLAVNSAMPDAKPNELFSSPLPLLEEDLLHLGSQKSADEWTNNFRDNFIKSRGYNKVKLLKAVGNLKLITDNLPVDRILKRIQLDTTTLSPELKQELYYLCSEYAVALDEDLGIMKENIQGLKDVAGLKQIVSDINNLELDKVWPYFTDLKKNVSAFCSGLKQKEIWDDSFTLDKKGFSAWYMTLVEGKKYAYGEDLTIKKFTSDRPFLKIKGSSASVCENGLHCARLTLDSVMSLYAVSQSLSSIAPAKGGISSNMGNPYASKVACGVYDPWAKRNKIIFDFFQDMATAAIFGMIPSPVYVSTTLEPKRVVSFETIVKEGKVFYDPRYDKNRLKLSLMTDLGPLAGIPCSVSISGTKLNPYQYYQFNGLSVSSCKERTRNDVTSNAAQDGTPKNDYTQACVTCAINLQTIAGAATTINPAFRVAFFVIKGMARLIQQIQDPNDLARNWNLNPQQVALAYRQYGTISKSCAASLARGESCAAEACEGPMVEAFTKAYQASPTVTSFDCDGGSGKLMIKECADPIKFRFDPYGSTTKLKFETKCSLKKREP